MEYHGKDSCMNSLEEPENPDTVELRNLLEELRDASDWSERREIEQAISSLLITMLRERIGHGCK